MCSFVGVREGGNVYIKQYYDLSVVYMFVYTLTYTYKIGWVFLWFPLILLIIEEHVNTVS